MTKLGDFLLGSFPFSRILLTNDDGIDAPGMVALEKVARQLAEDIWIVAPTHDQSGTSHSISLHDPLRVTRLDERRFAVSGTPGDCVAIGVQYLMIGTPPDLILSGINRGANLGTETVFSGTVGAAMTGMLLRIPSIALSQAFTDRTAVKWETSCALAPDVIRCFADLNWSTEACLNVNFPDCTSDQAGPLILTRQGRGLLEGIDVISHDDPRDLDYHWLKLLRTTRSDLVETETSALAAGHISVTPLCFERTHDAIRESLKKQMAQRCQS